MSAESAGPRLRRSNQEVIDVTGPSILNDVSQKWEPRVILLKLAGSYVCK